MLAHAPRLEQVELATSEPRVRVLIEDASPGIGGALTSLTALTYVLEARGHAVVVAAVAAEAAREVGLAHVEPLPVHRGAYATRIARRALALDALVRAHRPTVILANNAPATNAAAILVARAHRLPLVQYVRAPLDGGRLTRALLRRADAVLAVGEDATRTAGRRAITVDEGLVRERWPAPRHAEARRWLWCSVLARWKGLPLFVEAARRAGLEGVDVCAAELPEGADERAPRPMLPLGFALHVGLAPVALASVRAGAAVYVHTALRPEPFGRSILEAMAAGLAPVLPDEGSGPRLVEHERTGLLYPARSVDGLCDALRRLDREPRLRDALGQAAARAALAYDAEVALAPVVAAVERAGGPRDAPESRPR